MTVITCPGALLVGPPPSGVLWALAWQLLLPLLFSWLPYPSTHITSVGRSVGSGSGGDSLPDHTTPHWARLLAHRSAGSRVAGATTLGRCPATYLWNIPVPGVTGRQDQARGSLGRGE